MSISNFVSDLPPEIARGVCVIREEVAQTCSVGFSLSSSASDGKKQTRCLIRVRDVVSIFRLSDVKDVLSVVYDDQVHIRSIMETSVQGTGRSTIDNFIDDRGFMRVVARLATTRVRATPAEVTTSPSYNDKEVEAVEAVDRQHPAVMKIGGEYGGDGANNSKIIAPAAPPASVTSEENGVQGGRKDKKGNEKKKEKKTIRLRPFVKLNPGLSHITHMYGTMEELVKSGEFASSYAATRALTKANGTGRFRYWSECSLDTKSNFFRRGGRLPPVGGLKRAKCVEKLDGAVDGKVVCTYATMTDAAVGAGAGSKTYHAHCNLKRAIETGTAWKGCYWRFAAQN